MAEVKHTPGPWVVIADESAAQVKGFPCIESDGYTVVGLEGMYGDIETDFANARLIAAAPDMLEALQAAQSMHQRYCDRVGAADGWARDLKAIIDAAITKATGDPNE